MKEAYDCVVVHYSEIGLKGDNRLYFENALVNNIRSFMHRQDYIEVKRLFGRILVRLAKQSNTERVRKDLERVFGISNFSFAFESGKDIDEISRLALEKLKGRRFSTFRIEARRADKSFAYTSQDMNNKIGDFIRKSTKKKVKLEHPDLTIFVEVLEKNSFVYFEKARGLDGLPVGVSGRVLCLVSSGIDSPVAAFKMMKRGLRVDFIHFHSYPITSRKSIEKTLKLVKLLDQYQKNSRLYLIPFLPIQKSIVSETLENYRVILYRRMMVEVAEAVARKTGSKALVTGESIGQVASQTLDNLIVTDRASGIPVFRPLIGENKAEIIEAARKLGTFETSIQPHEDCCTLFIPKHPETRASLEKVLEMEKFFNKEELVSNALKDMKTRNF